MTVPDSSDVLRAGDGKANEADDWAVSSNPLPAITTHIESSEQGGATYWRCGGCGCETVYGGDQLIHAEGCRWMEGLECR